MNPNAIWEWWSKIWGYPDLRARDAAASADPSHAGAIMQQYQQQIDDANTKAKIAGAVVIAAPVLYLFFRKRS